MRRSSSLKNLIPPGSVKSKKSSNAGVEEERQYVPHTPDHEQQDTEWPLRTPSLHDLAEASAPRDYGLPTPPRSSHRQTAAGANEHFTAASNTEQSDPFTSTLSVQMPTSSAPSTTAAKPVRILEARPQEQRKDGGCGGCCIVM